MSIGVILTHFDEKSGFVPILYTPPDLDEDLVKEIVFRSTLNLVGGSKNISEERETFIDYPEHHLIGCSYLTSLESPAIRGGNMPVIVIFFVPTNYRTYIYHNLIQIMEDLKGLMSNIIPNWKVTKFQNIGEIKTFLSQYILDFRRTYSGTFLDALDKKSIKFVIQCPECSQESSIIVPNNVPNLLTIPIADSPCGHVFDAYFSKGPSFRGTSKAKSSTSLKDGLSDIFDKL